MLALLDEFDRVAVLVASEAMVVGVFSLVEMQGGLSVVVERTNRQARRTPPRRELQPEFLRNIDDVDLRDFVLPVRPSFFSLIP